MRMNEKMLRHILVELLQPIEQRLSRIETSISEISEIRTQLDTLEHRVWDIGENFRLALRRSSVAK